LHTDVGQAIGAENEKDNDGSKEVIGHILL
jgi:hypothetical protein